MIDWIIIGGGAAGVFAAIQAKTAHPADSVLILEKSARLLAKVRLTGGGRCNVTHASLDLRSLSENFPRGHIELLGPFHRFSPRDTISWFESRGVSLKTESDGRVFPVSNQSQSIIDCLQKELERTGVEIFYRQQINEITKENEGFRIRREGQEPLLCRRLILATGSSPDGYRLAQELGHTIQPAVPSLFTLNVPTSPFSCVSGIVIDPVELRVANMSQTGALLITHFGFSGPAVLKLSSWSARFLSQMNYQADLFINWLPGKSFEQIYDILLKLKSSKPQKMLLAENPFHFPRAFWKIMIGKSDKYFNDISLIELRALSENLHRFIVHIDGKTNHIEEFVTCGGVSLNEIHFKTMESKICPRLHIVGELLDIDGLTGGFNLQNAWTTGWIAGSNPK